MSEPYPDDADGDALRRVASGGADMSRPIGIDFFVAIPNREAGDAFARVAALSGYRTELVHDEEDHAWDCCCTKTMLPTHGEIVATQGELDEMSRPFGRYSDGWGTAGGTFDA